VQARRNVLTGRYPIPKLEDAFTLAGIQMQEQLGDIDPDLHKPGFLVYAASRLAGCLVNCCCSPKFEGLSSLCARLTREHDGLRLREMLPKSMFHVSRLKAVVKSLSQRMAEWEVRGEPRST